MDSIDAVDLIVRNVEYLKSLTMANKLKQLLMPIVIIIIGVLFIVSRWKLVDVVFIIIGAVITALGIYYILSKDDTMHIEKRDDDIDIE